MKKPNLKINNVIVYCILLFFTTEVKSQMKWKTISQNLPSPFVLVKSMEFENDNSLWVAGLRGLSHITPNNVTVYKDTVGQLPILAINQMKIHKGVIWLATDAGLVKFDKIKFTVYNTSSGLLSNEIKHLDIDSKGNVWMISGGKVSRFDGSNFVNYGDSATNIAVRYDDFIYATIRDTLTVNGVADDIMYFDGNNWIKKVDFTPGNLSLTSNFFNTSLQSSEEKNLYLVTSDASYYEITKTGFSNKVTPQAYNLRNKSLSGISENKKHRFFGTIGDGRGAVDNSGIVVESDGEYSIICDDLDKGGPLHEYYNIYEVATTNKKIAIALDNWNILIGDIPQTVENNFRYLDINNMKVGFNSSGNLFTSPYKFFTPEMEIPKNEGTHAVFYSGIWVSAVDASQSLKASASMYASDFESGIVNTSGSKRPNQILKINRIEIEKHKSDYLKSGYVIPVNIKNWPANGNSAVGDPLDLAKFIDVNNNGYYDPQNGDYPHIKGDQAVYFIFNDVFATDSFISSKPIGLEIHALAYAYKGGAKPELNNSFFTDFTVINRSTTDYDTVRFGQFLDFDLGCSNDDYVGCDSAKGAAYVYNGDNMDEDCHDILGYGNNPPAFALCPVNTTTAGFIYFNSSAGPQATQSPNSPLDIHNYLQSKWRDGTYMYKGGIGHKADPKATGSKTRFMWSGDPKMNTGWTERSSGHTPGDRRGLLSIEPFSLKSGERKTITMAYGYGRKSGGNNLDNIEESLKLLGMAKQYDLAQNNGNPVVASKRVPTGFYEEQRINEQWVIFPNPAVSVFYLSTPETVSKVELLDLNGKIIAKYEPTEARIQQFNLPPNIENGMYIVRFANELGIWATKRLVVK